MRQTGVQLLHVQVDDGRNMRPAQGRIEHRLVQPVQKLRPEAPAQQCFHLLPGTFLNTAVGVNAGEQIFTAQIGGKDQNGIFEIQIDGDLFKVTIKLPITNKPVVKQEKIASPTNEFGTAREIEIK